MSIDIILRVLVSAYLVGFGIFLIRTGDCFGAPRAALGVLGCGTSRSAVRLRDALDTRAAYEIDRPNTGLAASVVSFAIALAVVTTKLTPQLAYAFESCVVSIVLAIRFGGYRGRSATRAAVLERRELTRTVPWPLVTLDVLASLSLLCYATPTRSAACAAIIVMSSCLAMTALAVRIAKLPSRLENLDPTAEGIVDRRLRAYQATTLLVYATGPAFVFASFSNYLGSTGRFGSWALCASAMIVTCVWFFRTSRRGLSSGETIGLA